MTPSDFKTVLYDHYLSSAVMPSPSALRQTYRRGLPYVDEIIKRYFPKERGARIVDLGCGQGAFLLRAKELGYTQVAGVDTSPQQVAAAKSLGLTEVEQGDLLSSAARYSDQSIDLLITFDVLEHLSMAQLITFIPQVKRLLTANGRWLIHVPNAEGFFGPSTFYGDATHELFFTQRSLRQVLAPFGFDHVEVREDLKIVNSVRTAGRYLLWRAFTRLVHVLHTIECGTRRAPPIYSRNLLAAVYNGVRSESAG